MSIEWSITYFAHYGESEKRVSSMRWTVIFAQSKNRALQIFQRLARETMDGFDVEIVDISERTADTTYPTSNIAYTAPKVELRGRDAMDMRLPPLLLRDEEGLPLAAILKRPKRTPGSGQD